ncbi:hypothetical protein AK812_SmicGene33942 [Symbiodinium microadriaticum]|uniref:Uncharacterized protein n=1 Tax=Symbiodinium microadriaticum TaxID=2951 RepID=A0A1Q9CQC4_SYMMI|nr:hypothetical protein AK812_SmicGene33942 [Symbiodinium microadriaticum]
MDSQQRRRKEVLDIFAMMRYHKLDKVRDVNEKVNWNYEQLRIAKTILHTATVRVEGFGSACVGEPSRTKRDAQDSAARKFLSLLVDVEGTRPGAGFPAFTPGPPEAQRFPYFNTLMSWMLDDFKCQVEPATAWVGRCIVSTTIYGKIYGNRFVSEASPSQVDKRRAMQTQPLTPSLRYGQAEVKLREAQASGNTDAASLKGYDLQIHEPFPFVDWKRLRMKDLELNVLKETLIVEQRRAQQLKELESGPAARISRTRSRGVLPRRFVALSSTQHKELTDAPAFAAALIGHIDARSQDIEERRRVFKARGQPGMQDPEWACYVLSGAQNLILQWHPDKNEVFRYLMAKRDAFLATDIGTAAAFADFRDVVVFREAESDLDAGQEHGMDADHAPQTLEASFAMAATTLSYSTTVRQEKVKCRSGQADPDELDAEDSRLEVDGDVSDVQSMSEHDDLGDTDVHTVAMGWDVSILLQAASPEGPEDPVLISLPLLLGPDLRRFDSAGPGPALYGLLEAGFQ